MTTRKSAEFDNYPFLSAEEFSEVCHFLDRRYRQATLGPIRRQWRLNLRTALDTTSAFGAEYTTYIQITRPLDGDMDDGNLSLDLGNFSLDTRTATEDMAPEEVVMMETDEEADELALPKQESRKPDFGHVTYEIHLHPTYRAPCLWFSLHKLPADEAAFNIDTVFRRLVPDQYKDGLRAVGGIGGISADHHPLTSVPSFFVHPCLLGEAMTEFDCSKEDYLMVWLGSVGGCVGLWVPKEMALD